MKKNTIFIILLVLLFVMIANTCFAEKLDLPISNDYVCGEYKVMDIGLKMLPMTIIYYLVVQITTLVIARLLKIKDKSEYITLIISNTAYYLPIIYLISSFIYLGVDRLLIFIISCVVLIIIGTIKFKVDNKALIAFNNMKNASKLMLEYIPMIICDFIICGFLNVDVFASGTIYVNGFGIAFYIIGVLIMLISIICHVILNKKIKKK